MEFQSIVDELARIVKRPITVEDAVGRLIAYSVHEEPVDNVRMETLLRKGASLNTLDALRRRGVYECVDSATGIARVAAIPEIGFGPRICAPVKAKGKVLGYLWAVYDESIIPARIEEAFVRACQALASALLRRDSAWLRRDELQNGLVRDLIAAEPGDLNDLGEALDLRAKALGWYPSRPIYVVTVRAVSGADLEPVLRCANAFEESLQKHGVSFVRGTFESETVFVVSGISASEASKLAEKAGAWDRDMGEPGEEPGQARRLVFAVGMGTPGESLSDVRACYLESSRAINIGIKLGSRGPCFDYSTLAAYELVSCMATCPTSPYFGRRLVEKVRDYDSHRGTDLFATLEAYLDFYGKRKEAALRLDIHANTLDYRVRRIQEITGADLEDPNLRLVMHLWVKALRF